MPERAHYEADRRLLYQPAVGAAATGVSGTRTAEWRAERDSIVRALGDAVVRAARQRGPCLLPYHAWMAISERTRHRLMRRAARLGVPLSITLP
jgi:hypothetical protein